MYAVIKTGGKQRRVEAGKEIKIEKLDANVGESVIFDNVLLTSMDGKVEIGQPYLEDTKVIGTIIRQAKDPKVIVLKYKRRKGYRRKKGHRQPFTKVKIEGIEG